MGNLCDNFYCHLNTPDENTFFSNTIDLPKAAKSKVKLHLIPDEDFSDSILITFFSKKN